MISIVDHHRTTLDHRWAFRLDDPFWRIYVVDGDGAEVHGPGWRHALVANAVHLLPAWLGAVSACSRPVIQHWLHVTPEPPWREGQRCDGPLGAALARPWMIPDRDLAERLRGLVDLPRGSPLAHLRAAAVATAALDRVADLLPAAVRRSLAAATEDDRLDGILRYIPSHLCERLTVAELAGRVGLSPSRFTALFTARTGRSPMAWVRDQRIAAAAQRLADSDEDIAVIAEACGFANRHHFTRHFTAAHGRGPAAWRQEERTHRQQLGK